MKTDPIVDEVHRAREAISDRFKNNLKEICEDARKRQAASGRKTVQRSPRIPQRAPAKAG